MISALPERLAFQLPLLQARCAAAYLTWKPRSLTADFPLCFNSDPCHLLGERSESVQSVISFVSPQGSEFSAL